MTARTRRAGTTVLAPADVDMMLAAAVLAPSLHNTQPWAFGVGHHHVEVWADSSRQLPHSDPTGRSLLLSCGAALFNLRVGAAQQGLHPRVRILPDADEPTLVALVEVDHRHDVVTDLARYLPAVRSRRTNRQPFRDRRVPLPVVERLVEAADVEGAALRVYDEQDEVSRILDLLRAGDRADRDDPARVTERQRWVGGHHRPEGIPVRSLGPLPAGHGSPFRDLGYAVATVRESAAFEATPTIAVLSTALDRPVDWVRAGQALQRVLLEATRSGLAASFLNQALEHRDLRWLVRSPLTGVGQTHMLLRIGYGEPVAATPRRPLADVRRPARRMP